MAKVNRDIPKKRGRPKKDGRGIGVLVRFQPEALAAIRDWAIQRDEKLSDPEVIRRLVELGRRKG